MPLFFLFFFFFFKMHQDGLELAMFLEITTIWSQTSIIHRNALGGSLQGRVGEG